MTDAGQSYSLRISPQLWAEFGLLAKTQGKTRNSALVDMIRKAVIESQFKPARASDIAKDVLQQGGQVWGHRHMKLSEVNPAVVVAERKGVGK